MTLAQRSVIPDDVEFARMWAKGTSGDEIARHYGVTRGTVSRAAQRYGYARRQFQDAKPALGPAKVSETSEQRAISRLEVARARGTIAMPPFWTYDRDVLLIKSGGSYTDLTALAARWSRPVSQLLARWHLVRAL